MYKDVNHLKGIQWLNKRGGVGAESDLGEGGVEQAAGHSYILTPLLSPALPSSLSIWKKISLHRSESLIMDWWRILPDQFITLSHQSSGSTICLVSWRKFEFVPRGCIRTGTNILVSAVSPHWWSSHDGWSLAVWHVYLVETCCDMHMVSTQFLSAISILQCYSFLAIGHHLGGADLCRILLDISLSHLSGGSLFGIKGTVSWD
jgi:hypothetical protein